MKVETVGSLNQRVSILERTVESNIALIELLNDAIDVLEHARALTPSPPYAPVTRKAETE